MRYEGAIYRPPGEWRSYLLQCTVGCSNNTCTFCGMYKDKKFHIRPLKDILEDIDMAAEYYGRGIQRVFLCDGDAIVMKQDDLLTILEKLRSTFPHLERITSYIGPRSTLTKTPEQLVELRKAGLNRGYLGIETGSRELLAQIKKGCTWEEMLEAGVRVREAGIDLWGMIIVGLAGNGEASRQHALASADLVNKMKPRHLSALTLMADPGTELYDDVQAGRFKLPTANEVLEETRILIENINYGPLHFTSDHASNYLPLKGTLPDEKERMLDLIDRALSGKTRIRSDFQRGL